MSLKLVLRCWGDIVDLRDSSCNVVYWEFFNILYENLKWKKIHP